MTFHKKKIDELESTKKRLIQNFANMITRGIFSQQILTVCAIGPLQSDRAEALPCHMITVGGATLTLLSTLRSIEPS